MKKWHNLCKNQLWKTCGKLLNEFYRNLETSKERNKKNLS